MNAQEWGSPKVAVTGATGRVGLHLVQQLKEDVSLTLLARSEGDVHGVPVHVADILDQGALVQAFRGQDAVVHLAGEADRNASWDSLALPNFTGLVNVFEAARLSGVPRVIFASSNHVTGIYDLAEQWPVRPDQPVRPDGLYGASKVFGEAVGRLYADRFGINVICLRIGWVLDSPLGQHEREAEARMMWLSPGDLGRLLRGSLSSSVRFGIYYGVSDNTDRHWSIENATQDLGYQPADNSADWFSASVEATP